MVTTIPTTAQAWCSACRDPKCHERGLIFWARLAAGVKRDGHLIPLDWTPDPLGTWIVSTGRTRGEERYTRELRPDEQTPAGERYTQHWDTCAGKRRKGRAGQAAPRSADPADAIAQGTQGELFKRGAA